MSCPYYWNNYHYACRKSGKDVNEDIYNKYCQGYDYGDCPIYKGNDPGGCFLTSACVEAKGLPDDCYELTMLRNFRDRYLRSTESGQNEIAEYYFIAPQIVTAIKARQDAAAVFEAIYTDMIVPCIKMIEQGNNEDAHTLYRNMVKQLQAQYL